MVFSLFALALIGGASESARGVGTECYFCFFSELEIISIFGTEIMTGSCYFAILLLYVIL